MKKLIAATLCLSLAAAPVFAQEGKGDVGKGVDLMQEGTKLILRGLMAQMEPQMRALVAQLGDLMDNINAYQMPEVLPNGDIIIRRKVPLKPVPPGAEGNDIDL